MTVAEQPALRAGPGVVVHYTWGPTVQWQPHPGTPVRYRKVDGGRQQLVVVALRIEHPRADGGAGCCDSWLLCHPKPSPVAELAAARRYSELPTVEVRQWEPLDVAQRLTCQHCGWAGWLRAGRWVAAT